MSRFWPHPTFAEDQPYSHSTLYTHVLTRGLQAGSLFGSLIGTSMFFLRHFQVLKQSISPRTFTATLLRSTSVGAVVGTGLLAVATPFRMQGREEIEWQDRSWRLLENTGQVECDDWTYTGMIVGAVAVTARGGKLGWRGPVGGMGLGSVVGMFGYMGWRYAVHRGKRDED